MKPDGDKFKLVLTTQVETDDEYRKLLTDEFVLVFEEIRMGTYQFGLLEGNERVEQFYFSYDPNAEPNTYHLHLELIELKGAILNVSFSFERIRRFERSNDVELLGFNFFWNWLMA